MKLFNNRITVLTGHYGSGKTQIALNLALELRKIHKKVYLADLDIVNPYFRTQDSAKMLETAGIRLITSDYAGSNAEVPGMPAETAAVFDDESCRAVIDVGGDDRGALALGRYAGRLKENSGIFFVFNPFRLQTSSIGGTVEIMREIENSGNVKLNGIIFNPNLGKDTSAQDITGAIGLAQELSAEVNLPIVAKTVDARLGFSDSDWMQISIFQKDIWRI